jgi:hypothetical protein
MTRARHADRLSRADAETIALLDVVDGAGDTFTVTERLGLAPGLAPAVAEAMYRLASHGLLRVDDGVAAVTDEGRGLLSSVRTSER